MSMYKCVVRKGQTGWRPSRRCSVQLRCALVVLACLAASPGTARAVNDITNLGRPTNAVNNALNTAANEPLGGFRHVEKARYLGTRAEILWVGTMLPRDDWSASQRWPLIKALDQFGSFTGVRQAPQPCDLVPRQKSCAVPTFDWSRATYRSRYVALVHRELLDSRKREYQHLLGWEQKLFVRYAEISSCGPGPFNTAHSEYDKLLLTALGTNCNQGRGLPMILVGGYLQIRSDVAYAVDLEVDTLVPSSPTGVVGDQFSGMPFGDVHRALTTGVDPRGSHLVEDVNLETNLITAMICRADHLRPRSVCSRSAIKQVLKHVR